MSATSKSARPIRFRVWSGGTLLFTCQTHEMAKTMAAGVGGPTRIAAVRVPAAQE